MKKNDNVKKELQPYEIGELDQYLFGQGTHYEIYKKMGAHEVTKDGVKGVYFERKNCSRTRLGNWTSICSGRERIMRSIKRWVLMKLRKMA